MSASLIRDLGCEGMTYGPKWKDPAFVMECLCKYITEEGHRGLIGKTVAAAGLATAGELSAALSAAWSAAESAAESAARSAQSDQFRKVVANPFVRP